MLWPLCQQNPLNSALFDKQISELAYDADAHATAQAEESRLRHWDDERRELDAVSAREDADRAALADVSERLTKCGNRSDGAADPRRGIAHASLEGMENTSCGGARGGRSSGKHQSGNPRSRIAACASLYGFATPCGSP